MDNYSKYKSQQKGGEMRAENALRDENGRFGTIRSSNPKTCSSAIESGQLGQEAYSPAHNSSSSSSSNSNRLKRWEMHIETAMEDLFWLEVIAMQTKLPVFKRKTEIVAHFKRHVIVQGTEDQILSTRDAKSYFANYTRIGKPTYKRLVEELNRTQESQRKSETEHNPYRYEDKDPVTGERSYYGMPIPAGTPPRPNENAVLINGAWSVDN